jgi:hypothetical protein
VDVAELPVLLIEPPVRVWVSHALSADGPLHLG